MTADPSSGCADTSIQICDEQCNTCCICIYRTRSESRRRLTDLERVRRDGVRWTIRAAAARRQDQLPAPLRQAGLELERHPGFTHGDASVRAAPRQPQRHRHDRVRLDRFREENRRRGHGVDRDRDRLSLSVAVELRPGEDERIRGGQVLLHA